LNKIASGIIFTILLTSALIWVVGIQPVKATTITVPDDYATIQGAVNAANDGDTINVRAGTYYENVIINKKVSLVGEDRGTTIIDGSGNGNVVRMTSAANTANISAFTLRNGRGINDGAGIDVQSSSNHTITGNIITDNQRGLRLQFSHYNVICDNEITSNIETGIELRSSHWNSIFGNTASGNGLNIWIIGSSTNSIAGNEVADGDWGICLTDSFNNTLRNNNMNQNRFNFAVQGARVQDYIHDIDFSNLVNGKAVYYIVGKKNLVIDTSAYPEVGYIGIVNCENMTVTNLNLEANEEGIKLVNTTGSLIKNLQINGVSVGISIEFGSCNNTVSKNVVLWCEMVGIYLHGSSSYNVIYENQVTCLNSGIRTLDSSDNNLVYHNTFFQYFPQQMGFGSTNTWDNGYPSGGNYWSDYTGVDANSDGIGDTPYVIDSNNQDNYPLMKPYAGPHDIGIVSLSVSKTVIAQGVSALIRFEVINYGVDAEAFNVAVYANETTIFGLIIYPVLGRHSVVFSFTWITTPFAVGNYTISASASQVYGETDLSDNTLTYSPVEVTIPGDVNGDFLVNIEDATQVGFCWQQHVPPASPNVDINGDGIVNIMDASIVGVNWQKHA
jgi:parallel beta-helix repeat protein